MSRHKPMLDHRCVLWTQMGVTRTVLNCNCKKIYSADEINLKYEILGELYAHDKSYILIYVS